MNGYVYNKYPQGYSNLSAAKGKGKGAAPPMGSNLFIDFIIFTEFISNIVLQP